MAHRTLRSPPQTGRYTACYMDSCSRERLSSPSHLKNYRSLFPTLVPCLLILCDLQCLTSTEAQQLMTKVRANSVHTRMHRDGWGGRELRRTRCGEAVAGGASPRTHISARSTNAAENTADVGPNITPQTPVCTTCKAACTAQLSYFSMNRAIRASVYLPRKKITAQNSSTLTSFACWAFTGSPYWRRAWNWLFFVNVIIFNTAPNLVNI